MKYPTIYSIDFDGTIVEAGKFPEFGKPIEKVVAYIREIQNRGDDWILNTNRDGEYLEMAVKWLEENGLHPSSVNDNLPRMKDFFKRNPRKIFANVMIDDLNAGGVYLPPLDGGMDFGSAIRALKDGKKVARQGWNGKNQYITLGDEFTYKDSSGRHEAVHQTSGRKALVFHGTIGEQVGWLASQADMLSEDWIIVE